MKSLYPLSSLKKNSLLLEMLRTLLLLSKVKTILVIFKNIVMK